MSSEKTLGKLFLKRTKISKEKNSLGRLEGEQVKFYNYKEYRRFVESLTLAFIKHGLVPGTKVGLLSSTCLEWHLCDLGALFAGGIVIPFHPLLGPEDVVQFIEHSDCSMIVVENTFQLGKILYHLKRTKKIKLLLFLAPLSTELRSEIPKSIQVFSFQEFLKEGMIESDNNALAFAQSIEGISPHDPATIIYTFNDTRRPKGAVFNHLALVAALENIKNFTHGAIHAKDRLLVSLPLSHVYARVGSFLPIMFELEIIFLHPQERDLARFASMAPTIVLGNPKVLSKFYAQIRHQIEKDHYIKRKFLAWHAQVSHSYFDKIQQDLSPAPSEILKYKFGQRFLLAKIHRLLGGRIRFFISGGRSLAPEVLQFFRNLGLTILEGYGLTETLAMGTMNPLSKQVPFTAGVPMGDVQIKFTPEHEILIKTSASFQSYYKDPVRTKETLVEGWVATGDLGHFNSEGHLCITGKKRPPVEKS